MPKQKSLSIIPNERIAGKIYYIRGMKVMLDNDLAELYEVETKALNRAVRRNIDRFPDDFMFQLNQKEFEILRYHFGTSNNQAKSLRSQIVTPKRGGRRYFPLAFTEQGVAMLSSVLNSKRAIQVNIQIMRTFTKLREMLSTNKELRDKIEKMERENKENFKIIFKVIAKFIKTDPKGGEIKIIGFRDKK